jgi:ubiquinol-cytochrome c reductase cytochrome c subunit
MALMNRLSTRVTTLALALTCALGVCVHGAAAQTTPPAAAPIAGDPVHGKANFLKYGCYECHGTQAQGNYTGIPHLAPHPIPQAALLAYIRKPGGEMPSYSAAILPDRDAEDIWAYLNSIPAAKPPGDIPALAGVNTKPK